MKDNEVSLAPVRIDENVIEYWVTQVVLPRWRTPDAEVEREYIGPKDIHVVINISHPNPTIVMQRDDGENCKVLVVDMWSEWMDEDHTIPVDYAIATFVKAYWPIMFINSDMQRAVITRLGNGRYRLYENLMLRSACAEFMYSRTHGDHEAYMTDMRNPVTLKAELVTAWRTYIECE